MTTRIAKPQPIDIANTLHEFYRARDRTKELRSELIRLAVECGQDPKDAPQGAIEFLDGWLAGREHVPMARRTAT